ncbi:hypothetical protein AU210_007156 [Fusarium oxysporum f. sp. radicis-cucumerinum]|uniref:Uncharacterized protein n=1 Tax=Fusarium oxysporum f. sp. radicis-cucumerinum TaxID=327505 RepID=A0A2H3HAI0_FUSOX|nr:hypothetical protein AU210_007156 [Fusarium oxysporum f. sp. radicis-cucumerinum]
MADRKGADKLERLLQEAIQRAEDAERERQEERQRAEDAERERQDEHSPFNVRSTHQFRDLFEKQPRTGAGTRYIINVSSSAIHHNTGGFPLASYTLTKNSAALLLQKIADETDPSKTQIINFHPGSILTLRPKEYGLTADSANWDHEDLPGSFAVWAASPEAAFLHGRFVWAAWDVEELKSGPLREKLEKDDTFLKVTVKGI